MIPSFRAWMFNMLVNDQTRANQATKCKRRGCAATFLHDEKAFVIFDYNNPLPFYPCNGQRGKCGCTHAEEHLVMSEAFKNMPRPTKGTLLTTKAPCPACARLIVLTECVGEWYWLLDHHCSVGAEIVKASGIVCGRIAEGGVLCEPS